MRKNQGVARRRRGLRAAQLTADILRVLKRKKREEAVKRTLSTPEEPIVEVLAVAVAGRRNVVVVVERENQRATRSEAIVKMKDPSTPPLTNLVLKADPAVAARPILLHILRAILLTTLLKNQVAVAVEVVTVSIAIVVVAMAVANIVAPAVASTDTVAITVADIIVTAGAAVAAPPMIFPVLLVLDHLQDQVSTIMMTRTTSISVTGSVEEVGTMGRTKGVGGDVRRLCFNRPLISEPSFHLIWSIVKSEVAVKTSKYLKHSSSN